MADLANRKENSSSAVGYCMSINCPAIDFKQERTSYMIYLIFSFRNKELYNSRI